MQVKAKKIFKKGKIGEDKVKDILFYIAQTYPSLKEVLDYPIIPQLLSEVIREDSYKKVLNVEKINIQGIEFGEDLYRLLKSFREKLIAKRKAKLRNYEIAGLKFSLRKQIRKKMEHFKDFTKPFKEKIWKIVEKNVDEMIKDIIVDRDIAKSKIIPNKTVEEIFKETYNPYKAQVFIYNLKEELKAMRKYLKR
jgi:hypothetical protein